MVVGKAFIRSANIIKTQKVALKYPIAIIPKLSVNVFRSKSTINYRHLCSLFHFLFASNKAKRQFGELYSKKLTTLKMCYIAIHNKGACSLNLTNLTTHKMSSIVIHNKGPAVVISHIL